MIRPSYPRPAILDRIPKDVHAVLEASAGTGKTFTIEHLVVELLLTTPAKLDEILVVTFTEKATLELRERVRKLLEAILLAAVRGDRADDERHAWKLGDDARTRLERALFAFDAAPISTIHAFCQRILAEHAFSHRRLFEQELCDGRRAFGRAFREVLRRELAVETECRDLLVAWREEGSIDELEAFLFDAHRQGVDAGVGPLAPTSIDRLGEALRDVDEEERAGKRGAKRRGSIDLGPLRTALRSRDQGGLRAALGDVAASLPDAKGLTAAWKRLARLVLLGAPIADVVSGLERDVAARFLPIVRAEMDAKKAAEGLVDFDDMLVGVAASLEGPRGPALVEALRARFRYALIDEFQDTDPVQWAIFRRVFVASERRNLLYVIGDPKQAIYAFRGADVFTYLEAKDELAALGAPIVPLVDNFRSSEPLLDAVNEVLRADVPSPIFEGLIGYDAPVRWGGKAKAAIAPGGGKVAPVTLLHVASQEHVPARELKERYASAIAAEIARLVAGGGALHPDGRPFRASEIFVLTYRNQEGLDVADELRARGIPYAFLRQEGLFQTQEAHDVRDLFAAIADPHATAKRLRAWATPFFAVPWDALPACADLDAEHPLVERLLRWSRLAQQRRWPELFRAIVDESGIVRRELFLGDGERELTNVLHVLELLLAEATRERRAPDELVATLGSFLRGTASPPGENGNVQRAASDADAVQILTWHKSKGLEAGVVFVYGGFFEPPGQGKVHAIHEGHRRRVVVGKLDGVAAAKAKAERAEETQRLLYVALTRAKSKGYLPFVETKRKPSGRYAPLNARLAAIAAERTMRPELAALFDVVPVGEPSRAPVVQPPTAIASRSWSPDRALLASRDPAAGLDALRRTHAPLVVTSYTALKRDHDAVATEKHDVVAADTIPPGRLPGGRMAGRALHDAIEALDLAALADRPFEAWAALAEVDAVFRRAFDRHGVDPAALDEAKALVHRALTTPIALGPKTAALGKCRGVREMEVVFPLPERDHALLGAESEGFRIGRGIVRGFVDLTFEHEGLVYFADWKSDVLASYDHAAIERRVRESYALQAKIYSIAIVRWLGVRDEAAYEARFGGLLYVFLRGIGAEGQGTWFERPSFGDVAGYERELLGGPS